MGLIEFSWIHRQPYCFFMLADELEQGQCMSGSTLEALRLHLNPFDLTRAQLFSLSRFALSAIQANEVFK